MINPHNLSVLSYSSGHTQWHYATDDLVFEATSSGYFDKVCDMLRRGDFIFVNFRSGASAILVVRNINDGHVVITPLAIAD